MSSILRQLSCGTLGRERRANPQLSTAPASIPTPDKNFWDIEGYDCVLERLNNGDTICNDLIDIINDRASIEESYVKALRQWNKKWSDYLAEKSEEYGTSKQACYALLNTGETTGDFHYELHNKLIDKNKSIVADLKAWLKINYQKSHIHFKKRNEFDELFKDAQKQWHQYFKQLKKYEKEYHNSVKESIEAEQESNKAQKNPNKTDEQRRSAKQDADRAIAYQNEVRKRYEDQLKNMEPFKTDYMHDMKRVFDRAQEFEKTRLIFIKQIYEQYYKVFTEHINEAKYKALYQGFLEKINKITPDEDLKWWSNTYGAGMEPKWPSFIEYSN